MFPTNFPHVYFALSLLFLSSVLTSTACSSRQVIDPARSEIVSASGSININSADAAELEKLPGIGPGLAVKIVEHRKRYGPFRKREHLLMIEGMSDRRFREIENFVTVN